MFIWTLNLPYNTLLSISSSVLNEKSVYNYQRNSYSDRDPALFSWSETVVQVDSVNSKVIFPTRDHALDYLGHPFENKTKGTMLFDFLASNLQLAEIS
jgi:hypothetical protein